MSLNLILYPAVNLGYLEQNNYPTMALHVLVLNFCTLPGLTLQNNNLNNVVNTRALTTFCVFLRIFALSKSKIIKHAKKLALSLIPSLYSFAGGESIRNS